MILIVPDVHGRTFWHYALDHVEDYDKVIFLGDYLDPYSYEGVTNEQAVGEFRKIIEFKRDYPDKVELLIGNHCCPYIWDMPGYHCRHDYKRHDTIHELYMRHYKLFKMACLIDKYLFSHAGVYKEWLELINIKLEDFCDKDISFWNGKFQFLEYVSANRGGRDVVSSCVWADIYDIYDNTLLKDYYQIFGHTQLNAPIIKESFACLDVRKTFSLNLKTNELYAND